MILDIWVSFLQKKISRYVSFTHLLYFRKESMVDGIPIKSLHLILILHPPLLTASNYRSMQHTRQCLKCILGEKYLTGLSVGRQRVEKECLKMMIFCGVSNVHILALYHTSVLCTDLRNCCLICCAYYGNVSMKIRNAYSLAKPNNK